MAWERFDARIDTGIIPFRVPVIRVEMNGNQRPFGH